MGSKNTHIFTEVNKNRLGSAISLLFHDAGVLGAGDPADEPGGGDVHDKAFEGEGEEA